MYAYVLKGYTIGYTLTRRLLRNITSIPGMVLDAVFVAPFWFTHYLDYWRDVYAPYADGQRVNGFFRIILGWVGDLIGAVLGAVVGAIAGFALYIPDSIIRSIRWSLLTVFEWVDDFAIDIAQHSLFNTFVFTNPEHSYLKKAWNVSVGALGWLLGTALYLPVRAAEFFLPIGNFSSNLMWNLGVSLGGLIGTVVSVPIYPVYKIISSTIELYDVLRKKFVNAVALVYAKTNASIYEETENGENFTCIPSESVHSREFRQQVNAFKQTSFMSLLYGVITPPEIKPSAPPAPKNYGSMIFCPITQQPFEHPVIDRKGHTFEGEAIKQWITSQKDPTCPVGKEKITEEDLVPNRALETILSI